MKNRGEINTDSKKLLDLFKNYSYSIQYIAFAFGSASFLIGLMILIFFRDIQSSGVIIVALGIASLIISLILNVTNIGKGLLTFRGLYGINTFFILIAVIFILVATNSLIYILNSRGSSPDWFRYDLTATKEYDLSSHAKSALENLTEDLEVFIFLRADSGLDEFAIKRAGDLLSEFSKESTNYNIVYRHVDPDIEPTLSSNLNVDRYLAGRDLPVLVIRSINSRRTSYAVGKDPKETIDVFNENDVITSILVVNQIKQKTILFLAGHEERDITSIDKISSSFGQARITLERDNYKVTSATTDELARILLSGQVDSYPSALIIADPLDELMSSEVNLIIEYLNTGGNLMLLVEPDNPSNYSKLISPWGIVTGSGVLVDTVSYVAPNVQFLQVKDTNMQIPDHPITHNFDVMYFPGSKFVGLSLKPEEIPTTPEGEPFLKAEPIAYTTLNSWEEASRESVAFDQGIDIPGPLPIVIAIEAISPIDGTPIKNEKDEFIKTKIIISGDTDFASNKFLFSAKNEDLFANSINWLTSDVELISIRPKVKVFRELVLTSDERRFVRWSGWIFLPALSLASAAWTWWRRR